MKPLGLTLLVAFTTPSAYAQKLSNSDREALIERLEIFRKEASSTVDARFRTAISAYRSAMASPNATMELYLKCEELLNFEEMQKRHGDFREWKKKNEEKFGDSAFREALRQQLRWLVLTLEAASEDPDREKLAREASGIIDGIVSSAENFPAHRDILQQGVTSSVFARAYEINGIDVKDWPFSPLPIAAVYEQVILPPLRRTDRLTSLQSAWGKRIAQENSLIDAWGKPPGETAKAGERSPDAEKFLTETLPALRWEAEMDLFTHGDEKGAAVRMVELIHKNMSHKNAPKWIEELTSLLQNSNVLDVENPEPDGTVQEPPAPK